MIEEKEFIGKDGEVWIDCIAFKVPKVIRHHIVAFTMPIQTFAKLVKYMAKTQANSIEEAIVDLTEKILDMEMK